jgi:hypothetical protein
MPGEEAVLIGRILARRKELFDELLKPHLAPLSRVVHAKMGSGSDAEDVVPRIVAELPDRSSVWNEGRPISCCEKHNAVGRPPSSAADPIRVNLSATLHLHGSSRAEGREFQVVI